jgi:lipoprotein signal peptidase
MDRSSWTYLTISALLITLDQATKYYFQKSVRAFINQEGSFSFPLPPWLTIVISIVIITALSHLLFSKTTPASLKIGTTFILSGGAGNLIDRILYGYVQDIIAISSTRFNLADTYIFIGAVFLLFGIYRIQPKSKPTKENN